MELSARVEYALLALLKLSDRRPNDKPLTVNEIAIDRAIPERYLDQILIALRRHVLVQSQRGIILVKAIYLQIPPAKLPFAR